MQHQTEHFWYALDLKKAETRNQTMKNHYLTLLLYVPYWKKNQYSKIDWLQIVLFCLNRLFQLSLKVNRY